MSKAEGTSDSGIRLTIAEDNVKPNDVTKGFDVDVKERDPNHLHDDMKIQFHDIIGEPSEDVFSFDCVWIYSFKIFTNTKLWCYRITSLLCAIPVSFCWGCYFACYAFHAIWLCTPCLKVYHNNLRLIHACITSVIETFIKPCYMAAGYIFYNIRITKGHDSGS